MYRDYIISLYIMSPLNKGSTNPLTTLNVTLYCFFKKILILGPRLFLPCPIDVDGSRVWFTDLWNYSLVPYIMEAVREGLQVGL